MAFNSHHAHTHSNRSLAPGFGRRPTARYSGTQRVLRTDYREWELIVCRRMIGSTVRRESYSVDFRLSQPSHEEMLSGFASLSAAVAGAQRRINHLEDILKIRWQGPRARRWRRLARA